MATLLERAKQRFHIGEKTFHPTPNVRNPAMIQEAEDFAVHMKAWRSALRRYEAVLMSLLRALPKAGESNLPRVWETVEGSLCEPLRNSLSQHHPTRTFGDYDVEGLHNTLEVTQRRIEHDIAMPMDCWLAALAVAKARTQHLEPLRLDLDARRRSITRRYMRVLRRAQKQARGSSSGGSSSSDEEYVGGSSFEHERQKEDFRRDVLFRQRQLEAVQQTYIEQEQLIFEQLSALVRDSAWLKSYVAAGFLVVKEALQAAALCLGACKQPLPGFAPEHVPVAARVTYGAIADNYELITATPQVLDADQLTYEQEPVLEAMRVKKIAAAPLQVAVDPSVPPYDTAPSFSKSARRIQDDDAASGAGTATTEQYMEANSRSQSVYTTPEKAEYGN